MKTIKIEDYKGYKITVKAEFIEDTTRFHSDVFENLDSVKFEVITQKGHSYYQLLKGSVEEGKSHKKAMYDAFNSGVEDLIKTTKEIIDKKEREKEMTDGLPESLLKDFNKKEMIDLYLHIFNKFGIAPVLVGKLSETEMELFKNHKEKELEGLTTGGYTSKWGSGGKLAVLHNDYVLNKGDSEKLFQSAVESAKLLGKSLSEVMDSYVEFAKQGTEDELEKLELRKMQEILDEKWLGAKEDGVAIGKALKSVLARISDVPSVKENLKKYGISTDGTAEMTLKDLASKWRDLDDEQKKLVGVDVAGVYKLSGFIMALSELNRHKD